MNFIYKVLPDLASAFLSGLIFHILNCNLSSSHSELPWILEHATHSLSSELGPMMVSLRAIPSVNLSNFCQFVMIALCTSCKKYFLITRPAWISLFLCSCLFCISPIKSSSNWTCLYRCSMLSFRTPVLVRQDLVYSPPMLIKKHLLPHWCY